MSKKSKREFMAESQEWLTFLIVGKEIPRIKIKKLDDDLPSCSCGGKIGQYHRLGCIDERCPHCGHFVIDCEAEGYVEGIQDEIDINYKGKSRRD